MSEIRNPSQNLAINALELIARSGFFGHSELGHRHCTTLANNTLEELKELQESAFACYKCKINTANLSYKCPAVDCPLGLGPATC